MLAKIREGIVLGIGIGIGMLIINLALSVAMGLLSLIVMRYMTGM